MEKARDLFQEIRDTKGTFHAKMGTIKGRNGMDLTEAEDTKRGGKNTQKNYTQKILITQITIMVYNHSPRARKLECEVKWALRNITINKASGNDGI